MEGGAGMTVEMRNTLSSLQRDCMCGCGMKEREEECEETPINSNLRERDSLQQIN